MNYWICPILLSAILLCIIVTDVTEAALKSSVNRRDVCPRKCECNVNEKEVACHYKRLRWLPRGVPSWTKILSLTGNHIRHVPRNFFRKLADLEEINLNGNLLTKIPSFTGAKKLRKINLASNKITQLQKKSFKHLFNLEILTLSKNKIGKLGADTFKDTSNIVEIRLDDNEMQTLETAVFENMTSLKILHLHNNRWHCDCQLKKLELYIRRRNIKHGFIICDSPSARDGQVLGDIAETSLCGQDVETMIGALLGVLIGLIVFIFALFMCRKAANFIADKEMADRALNGGNKASDLKKTTDDSVRSSIVSIG